MIINRLRHNSSNIRVGEKTAATRQNLRYLGIQLDEKFTFSTHAKIAASRAVQNLARILPYVNATKNTKKILLSSVI